MKRYHQVMNIVVIGVGYVGLITGLGLSHLNHKVQFVDIDSEKIILKLIVHCTCMLWYQLLSKGKRTVIEQ